MNRPLNRTDHSGLQTGGTLNEDPNEVIARIATVIDSAGKWITRTFSYGGDTVRVRDPRVPIADSNSGSDPLQNANYLRFQSVMNATNGDDDGGLTRRMVANKGASTFFGAAADNRWIQNRSV